MKDLTKTASTLDKICRVLSIILTVATVALIVGLVILAAGFLFDLPPQMVGNGYATVELDFIILTIADNYIPDHTVIWKQAGAEIFLTLLCLVPAHFILKSIRAILAPMKNGEPFHNTVSIQLGKIARYVFVLGVGLNLHKIISSILLTKAFDLHLLLLSEKITPVNFRYKIELGFLLVCAILLRLSYVFRYGEELQRLSDETL